MLSADKCLTTDYKKKSNCWSVVSANFHGINTPTVAYCKLLIWCQWMYQEEEMLRASQEPVCTISNTHTAPVSFINKNFVSKENDIIRFVHKVGP